MNIFKRQIYIAILILCVVASVLTSCQSTDEIVTVSSSLNDNSSESLLDSSTSSESSMEAAESSHASSAFELSHEESQFITPNPDIPIEEIPQPDDPPDIKYEPKPGQEYESGRITLSLRGDSEVVEISDDLAKATILGYIDSMQESSYNAENTPPGSGYTTITVAVHRNNVIEEYIFSNYTADGNSLGKNLQGDVFYWTIIDSNALPYLLGLIS